MSAGGGGQKPGQKGPPAGAAAADGAGAASEAAALEDVEEDDEDIDATVETVDLVDDRFLEEAESWKMPPPRSVDASQIPRERRAGDEDEEFEMAPPTGHDDDESQA